MAERLVVVKSQTQNRVEGVLVFVLPLGLSLLLCYIFGRPNWYAVAQAPLSLWGTPAAGGVVAAYLGGERVAPEERYRRIFEQALKMPIRTFVTSLALYVAFFAAMFVPMTSDLAQQDLVLFAGMAVAGAFVMSIGVTLGIRQFGRRYSNGAKATESPMEPGLFLRKDLPLYYACVFGGGLVGLIAGLMVDGTARLLVLAAGTCAGVLIHQFIRARRPVSTAPPILWYQLNLRWVLLFSFLQFGVLFAAFFAAMAPLSEDKHDDFVWVSVAVFALAGILFGMLSGLFFWAISRISNFRARDRA